MRLFVAAYPSSEAVADLAAFVGALRVGQAAAAGTNTRLARPETYHLTLAFLGDVADERLADVEQAVGQGVERYYALAARAARRAARVRAGEDDGDRAVRGRGEPRRRASLEPRQVPDRPIAPGEVGEVRTASGGGGGGSIASGLAGARTAGRGVAGGDRGGQDVVSADPRRAATGDPARPKVPELALAGGGRFGRGAFTLMWVGVTGDLDPMRTLHKALRRELKHAGFPYDERPWKPHLTIARPGNRIPRADLDADRAELNEYTGPTWPVRELFLVRSHLGPNPSYERLTNWLL